MGQVPQFSGGTAAIPNIYEIDPGFRDGRAQNWSAGIERELPGGLSLGISYLGNHVNNLGYNLPTNLTQTGVLADGRIQYGGSASRIDPNIGIVYLVKSSGTYQNYNAVLVELKLRLSHGFSFQTGYQYQHIAGCFSRAVPMDNGGCFNQGTASMNQPNRFTATAVWEPHVSTSYRPLSTLVNGWLLANTSMVQNGLSYTAITGQDNNGDGSYNDPPLGFGVNTFRIPLYVQVDFRLSRKFGIGELGGVEFFAEALNSTNQANIYGVNCRSNVRSS